MKAYCVHLYLEADGEETRCYFSYPPMVTDILRYLDDHPGSGGIGNRCASLLRAGGLRYEPPTAIHPYAISTTDGGFIEISLIFIDRQESESQRSARMRHLIEQRRDLRDEFMRLLLRGEILGTEINSELGLVCDTKGIASELLAHVSQDG